MWPFNLILNCKSKKVGRYKKINDECENKTDDHSSEFSTEGSVNAQPNGKVYAWSEFSKHSLMIVHYWGGLFGFNLKGSYKNSISGLSNLVLVNSYSTKNFYIK